MADEEKNETTEERGDARGRSRGRARGRLPRQPTVADAAPEAAEAAAAEEPEADASAEARGLSAAGRSPSCRGRAGAGAGSACQEAALAQARPAHGAPHAPEGRRARSRQTRKPITRTAKPESELGRRQERRGVVVSDKGDKTIVVKVDVIKSHPQVQEGRSVDRQVPRARRGEHRRRRRHGPHRRDAAAVEAEALAARRDRGEGEVDDPAGNTPQGRRQHGCS